MNRKEKKRRLRQLRKRYKNVHRNPATAPVVDPAPVEEYLAPEISQAVIEECRSLRDCFMYLPFDICSADPIDYELPRPMREIVRRQIRDVPVFEISAAVNEFNNYVASIDSFDWSSIRVALPANRFFIEYTDEAVRVRFGAYVFLYTEAPPDKDEHIYIGAFNECGNIIPNASIFDEYESVLAIFPFTHTLDDNRLTMANAAGLIGFSENNSPEPIVSMPFPDDYLAKMYYVENLIVFSLALMSAENVSYEHVIAARRNRHQNNVIDPTRIVYHRLKLNIGEPAKKYPRYGPPSWHGKARHFCRGHFRRRPVSGGHTYVRGCWKGDEKYGLVTKSYEIR